MDTERAQIDILPRVGFEPTTAVFQRAEAVHALDREPVIGVKKLRKNINFFFKISEKKIIEMNEKLAA
jgi:hypothetical protein